MRYIVQLFVLCFWNVLVVSCSYLDEHIKKFDFDGDSLKIIYTGKQGIYLDYIVSYQDIILHSESIYLLNDREYTLKQLEKNEIVDNIDAIAYKAASIHNIDFRYVLKKEDKIFIDSIRPYYTPNSLNKILNSEYAIISDKKYGKIEKKYSWDKCYRQAKSYLVQNNIVESEEFIGRMAYNIYSLLNRESNFFELSNLNVVHELPNIPITVSTNMDYDYFYLLAVKNEAYLKDFVNSEIVNDFKCCRENSIRGYKQINLRPMLGDTSVDGLMFLFLLGINKDWNYSYYPVGGIIVDNSAPILLPKDVNVGEYAKMYINYVTNSYAGSFEKCNIETITPAIIQSKIRDVTWGNFEGNNLWGYPITFIVSFEEVGDIKYIIVQNKKYKINALETIQNNNRFVFEHHFPRLNIGDNYITFRFVDELGNMSSAKINIATESIRN